MRHRTHCTSGRPGNMGFSESRQIEQQAGRRRDCEKNQTVGKREHKRGVKKTLFVDFRKTDSALRLYKYGCCGCCGCCCTKRYRCCCMTAVDGGGVIIFAAVTLAAIFSGPTGLLLRCSIAGVGNSIAAVPTGRLPRKALWRVELRWVNVVGGAGGIKCLCESVVLIIWNGGTGGCCS